MRRVPIFTMAWLGLVIIFWFAAPWFTRHPGLIPACPMKVLTGIPCATCGLTRCLLHLRLGDLPGAFHWHPVATLVILASPLLLLWDLWRAARNRPWPGLPDHWGFRLAAFLGIAGTWALQVLRGI